jgi:hypothetical protein
MTATHSDGHLEELGDGDVPAAVPVDESEAPSGPPLRAGRFALNLHRVPHWVAPVAVGGLALGSCIYVGLVDPNTTNSAFYPQCAFKAFTGLDCPGCGLTRAMHAVVTGHPVRALDHNILIALILPLAVYTYLVWMTKSLFGWDLPYVRVPKKLGYALAPMLIAFWILRNIPIAPFNYLNSSAAGV